MSGQVLNTAPAANMQYVTTPQNAVVGALQSYPSTPPGGVVPFGGVLPPGYASSAYPQKR